LIVVDNKMQEDEVGARRREAAGAWVREHGVADEMRATPNIPNVLMIVWSIDEGQIGVFTSGKVPLEKTLWTN